MSTASREQSGTRRWLEAVGWVLLVALLWTTDLYVKMAEREQTGVGKDDFRLITEQVTSAMGVLVMIPFVVYWLRVFPLRRDAWVPAIVGHTVGTALFAAGHYSLMVVQRMAVFAVADLTYVWRDPFLANLVLEYQKDIKIYAGILAVVIAYRHLTGSPRKEVPPSPGTDRLLVQTGSGTGVLRFEEIDYLEGARNYVSVYAGSREYVIRDTMTRLMGRLSPGPFLRIHRSYIVNLDKVREIRSVDSKPTVVLLSGAELPVSRSHRDDLRRAVGDE